MTKLDVTGDIHATGIVTADSDIRLKKNISPLNRMLKKILLLNPVYFQWNAGDDRRYMGFIAQNVRDIFPELVRTGNDGILSVNYMQVTAPTVASIQELNQKVENQNDENQDLKLDNKNLRDEIESIKKSLHKLNLSIFTLREKTMTASSD